MGEYMASDDGPRETLRRNMKYERIAPTLLYRKLQLAVANYLADPFHKRQTLEKCRDELMSARDGANSPTARDNAVYALRALETFENSMNALPLSEVIMARPPIYKPRVIEGVKISIQPTALISVPRRRGRDLKGALIVDAAKGQAAKSDETRARNTLAMQYAAYLLHEHVADLASPDDEKSSPEHCMIFHSHRQETVCCPDNYRRDLRNIQAACRQIAAVWDSIEPPASFDPKRARYRS